MKVLHLSTFKSLSGGAVNAYRLHKSLQQEGIDSFFYYPSKFFLPYFFSRLFEKAYQKTYQKNKRLPFSFNHSGGMYDLKKKTMPDIIHLHWVQGGFLSIENIAILSKLVPVVWTLHDSFPFTGGCHVKLGCEKHKSTCSSCPQLKKDSFSKQQQEQKRALWQSKNMFGIAPSVWMLQEAMASKCVSSVQIKQIYNGIDSEIFYPQKKELLKSLYKIPQDKPILFLGLAPSKKDYHKGSFYFNQLIQDEQIKKEYYILMIENKYIKKTKNVFFLPPTFQEKKIAEYYALSDLFVCCSIDENLPTMLIESIACGTPVIAFSIGGIPEIVINDKNGFLIKKENIMEFKQKILAIKPLLLAGKLKAGCGETIKKFNLSQATKQHIKYYEKICP